MNTEALTRKATSHMHCPFHVKFVYFSSYFHNLFLETVVVLGKKTKTNQNNQKTPKQTNNFGYTYTHNKDSLLLQTETKKRNEGMFSLA